MLVRVLGFVEAKQVLPSILFVPWSTLEFDDERIDPRLERVETGVDRIQVIEPDVVTFGAQPQFANRLRPSKQQHRNKSQLTFSQRQRFVERLAMFR